MSKPLSMSEFLKESKFYDSAKKQQKILLVVVMFVCLFFISVSAVSWKYWDNPDCQSNIDDKNLISAMFLSFIAILIISIISCFFIIPFQIGSIAKSKSVPELTPFFVFVICMCFILLAASITIVIYVHSSILSSKSTAPLFRALQVTGDNTGTETGASLPSPSPSSKCDKDGVNFDVVAGLGWSMLIILLLFFSSLAFSRRNIFYVDPSKIKN